MSNQANFFELSKGKTKVIYSEGGFVGIPTLSYQDGSTSISSTTFIEEKTALGRLLTMTIEVAPDLYTKNITLLLPHVHLDDDNEAEVKTLLIYASEKSNFAGHDAVRGQVTDYKSKSLKGTASFVV